MYIVISEGDQVVTPAYGLDSYRRLQAQGVQAQLILVPGDLPHMFMMFEVAARQVGDILCTDEPDDSGGSLLHHENCPECKGEKTSHNALL